GRGAKVALRATVASLGAGLVDELEHLQLAVDPGRIPVGDRVAVGVVGDVGIAVSVSGRGIAVAVAVAGRWIAVARRIAVARGGIAVARWIAVSGGIAVSVSGRGIAVARGWVAVSRGIPVAIAIRVLPFPAGLVESVEPVRGIPVVDVDALVAPAQYDRARQRDQDPGINSKTHGSCLDHNRNKIGRASRRENANM